MAATGLSREPRYAVLNADPEADEGAAYARERILAERQWRDEIACESGGPLATEGYSYGSGRRNWRDGF